MLKVPAWLDGPGLLRGTVALLPGLLLYIVTGQEFLLTGGLLTIALLIGVERCQRSLLLLLVHALLLGLSIAAFFAVEVSPPLFVLLCGLYGFLSLWIARLGARWTSVGSFTFIPALYLSIEGHAAGVSLADGLRLLALALPLAVGSVLLASVALPPRGWRLGWRRWPQESAQRHRLGRQALVRALAVLVTALAVSVWHPPFGQWVIWSSASVATGELTSARRKGLDRAVGALVGLSAGVGLGLLLPRSAALHAVGIPLTLLTLVAFRNYRAAFASRCALIVLTAAAGGEGLGIGLDRLVLVVVGGAVGLALVQWGLRAPAEDPEPGAIPLGRPGSDGDRETAVNSAPRLRRRRNPEVDSDGHHSR